MRGWAWGTAWAPWAAGASLFFAFYTFADTFWLACGPGLLASLKLGVLVLVAASWGRRALRGLELGDAGERERTLIGASLGLGAMSLAVFFLAAGGLLGRLSVCLLLAGLGLAGLGEMRAAWESLPAPRAWLARDSLARALLLALLLAVFWAAWVPPHQYDSLVYHLPLAQAYAKTGSLVWVQHLVYYHFPQNAEMLFALALVLGSDLLAQQLMWLAAALSAGWIFEAGRRQGRPAAALLACLLLCTHAAVMLLASTTYVEPLVMLWVTAATLCFLRGLELSSGGPFPRSWLVLSAVFTGLALGTKYYAGIAAALLGACLAWRALLGRLPRREGRTDLALYVGITTALFLPWLAKNYLTVGNPVFPFLYERFSGAPGWTAESARGYFRALVEYGPQGGFWAELLSLPVKLLRNDPRFGGGMDALGRLGWEATFWFLPLGFWACRRDRFWRGLALFCGLYLAAWFATGVVLRFLTAIAPLLCLLIARGLHDFWGLLGPGGRLALGAGAGLLAATHLLLFAYVHRVVGSGAILLGLESRREFLARRLDYYPCAAFAAERLGKNDKILIVGEQRGYYVEQDHAATTVHAPNPYILWAEEAGSPRDLAGRLSRAGYTHMLFVPREFSRLGPSIGTLTERGRGNLAAMEPQHLKAAFQGPACTLYALQ